MLEHVAGIGGERSRVAAAVHSAEAHEDGVELACDGRSHDFRARLAAGDLPFDVPSQGTRSLRSALDD
jgi:hypothetical protein